MGKFLVDGGGLSIHPSRDEAQARASWYIDNCSMGDRTEVFAMVDLDMIDTLLSLVESYRLLAHLDSDDSDFVEGLAEEIGNLDDAYYYLKEFE